MAVSNGFWRGRTIGKKEIRRPVYAVEKTVKRFLFRPLILIRTRTLFLLGVRYSTPGRSKNKTS